MRDEGMIVVWFSCGAASAVAAKLTIEQYGRDRIRVVNNFILDEDEDNRRFLKDVEKWLGITLEQASNPKYPKCSCEEVWEDRQYMSGIHGAPCTLVLKKEARYLWEDKNKPFARVMGFTVEERARFMAFDLEQGGNNLPVLIDAGLTKQDCFDILVKVGIEPPKMYALGYPNANCPGCVKATSPTYWNHVRVNHPEIFKRRSEQSRRIGARLVRYKGKRIFLDELPPDARGASLKSMKIECGIFCEPERGILKLMENKLNPRTHEPE